jgi:hypothetical protein
MQNLTSADFANTGLLPADSSTPATTLQLINGEQLADFTNNLSATDQQWLTRQSFTAKAGQVAWLENGDGVLGKADADSLATLGHLPYTLPEGVYRLAETTTFIALLGWGLGSYSFNRYKAAEREPAQLILPRERRCRGASEYRSRHLSDPKSDQYAGSGHGALTPAG